MGLCRDSVGNDLGIATEIACLLATDPAGATVQEACQHAGILMDECIIDTCLAGTVEMAQAAVMAAHDLAIDLGIVEETDPLTNPDWVDGIDVCIGQDCGGEHGECLPVQEATYECVCDADWHGERCSQPGPQFLRMASLHNWACECPLGTDGISCESLVPNPCDGDLLCYPDGTLDCVVTSFEEYGARETGAPWDCFCLPSRLVHWLACAGCLCKPGYRGDLCDMEIDECCSSPCEEGDRCIDLLDGFSCQPPSFFSAGGKDTIVVVEDAACTTVASLGWLWALLLCSCLGAVLYKVLYADKEAHEMPSQEETLPLIEEPSPEPELEPEEAVVVTVVPSEKRPRIKKPPPLRSTVWILFVVEPSGVRHAFEVLESEWNIDTVQTRVHAATGMAAEDQVLKYGKRVLKKGKKLTSYGVQHGSELQLEAAEGTAAISRTDAKAAQKAKRLAMLADMHDDDVEQLKHTQPASLAYPNLAPVQHKAAPGADPPGPRQVGLAQRALRGNATPTRPLVRPTKDLDSVAI
eukprot:SAG11_NODE_1477_length_4837_cov_2.462431_2_plen_524_part_00